MSLTKHWVKIPRSRCESAASMATSFGGSLSVLLSATDSAGSLPSLDQPRKYITQPSILLYLLISVRCGAKIKRIFSCDHSALLVCQFGSRLTRQL